MGDIIINNNFIEKTGGTMSGDLVMGSGANLTSQISGQNNIGSQSDPFNAIYVNNIISSSGSSTVSVTLPLTETSGVISINSGSAFQDGYLSSGDWVRFNNGPTGLYLPITGGTLTGPLVLGAGSSLSGTAAFTIDGPGISLTNTSAFTNLTFTNTQDFGEVEIMIGSSTNSGGFQIVDVSGALITISSSPTSGRVSDEYFNSIVYQNTGTQIYPQHSGTVTLGTAALPFASVYANEIFEGSNQVINSGIGLGSVTVTQVGSELFISGSSTGGGSSTIFTGVNFLNSLTGTVTLTANGTNNLTIAGQTINISGSSIPGPSGATGPIGPTGITGPQGATGPTGVSGVVTATLPLIYNAGTQNISETQASATGNGWLSSGDWVNFNAKQAAGNYVVSGTSTILSVLNIPVLTGNVANITNLTGTNATFGTLNVTTLTAVTGLFTTVQEFVATGNTISGNFVVGNSITGVTINATNITGTTINGTTIFENGVQVLTTGIGLGNVGVSVSNGIITITGTSTPPVLITGTAPVLVTGSTIGIGVASTSTSGYLTSTDWNTFNSAGTGLSNYLPLKGGTLTGGLIGTSAAFSSITGTSISGSTINVPVANHVVINASTITGTTINATNITGTTIFENGVQVLTTGIGLGTVTTSVAGGVITISGSQYSLPTNVVLSGTSTILSVLNVPVLSGNVANITNLTGTLATFTTLNTTNFTGTNISGTTATIQTINAENVLNLSGSSVITNTNNSGTGFLLFINKTGNSLNFNTLNAGTNVTITTGTNGLTINASGVTGATGNFYLQTGGSLSGTLIIPDPYVIQANTINNNGNTLNISSTGILALSTTSNLTSSSNGSTTLTSIGQFNINSSNNFGLIVAGSINAIATGNYLVNSSGVVQIIAQSGLIFGGNVTPTISGTYDVGSAAFPFNNIYGNDIVATSITGTTIFEGSNQVLTTGIGLGTITTSVSNGVITISGSSTGVPNNVVISGTSTSLSVLNVPVLTGTVANFTNLTGTLATFTTLNATNFTGTNISGTTAVVSTLNAFTSIITPLTTVTTLNATNITGTTIFEGSNQVLTTGIGLGTITTSVSNGVITISGSSSGGGTGTFITVPTATTNSGIAIWSGTTGAGLLNSSITIDPLGDITLPSGGNLLGTVKSFNSIGTAILPFSGIFAEAVTISGIGSTAPLLIKSTGNATVMSVGTLGGVGVGTTNNSGVGTFIVAGNNANDYFQFIPENTSTSNFTAQANFSSQNNLSINYTRGTSAVAGNFNFYTADNTNQQLLVGFFGDTRGSAVFNSNSPSGNVTISAANSQGSNATTLVLGGVSNPTNVTTLFVPRGGGGPGSQMAFVALQEDDGGGGHNSHITFNTTGTTAPNINAVFVVASGDNIANTKPSALFARSVGIGVGLNTAPNAMLQVGGTVQANAISGNAFYANTVVGSGSTNLTTGNSYLLTTQTGAITVGVPAGLLGKEYRIISTVSSVSNTVTITGIGCNINGGSSIVLNSASIGAAAFLLSDGSNLWNVSSVI